MLESIVLIMRLVALGLGICGGILAIVWNMPSMVNELSGKRINKKLEELKELNISGNSRVAPTGDVSSFFRPSGYMGEAIGQPLPQEPVWGNVGRSDSETLTSIPNLEEDAEFVSSSLQELGISYTASQALVKEEEISEESTSFIDSNDIADESTQDLVSYDMPDLDGECTEFIESTSFITPEDSNFQIIQELTSLED